MKRQTLVIAGLALLSTNAFASKARVEALGQDGVRGSEFISDSRNVFRNPAVLNDTKNYLVTEWGTAATTDTAAAPRAEGGFFREAGSFAYGLYLGNSNGRDDANRSGAAEYLNQTNAMDLFFAGDMGVKWGAKLHYASSKDQQTGAFERKNTAFGLGLGAVMGSAEAYLDLDLSDKSNGAAAASDEWKLKPSFLVGGSYAWEGTTFFANYESSKYEVKTATTATTKDSTITVGAGRIMEINPTARVFTDAKVVLDTTEVAAGKTKSQTLPVTLGMEAEATSWLTLRGSVAQNVILNNNKNAAGKKSTTNNTTNVNAGATLNFGKLKVDGVIGTTGGNRGTGTTSQEQGVLATDNLLTRVGVTYMF
ncbi:MAG: hypothetical protein HOP07_11275 [Bacteriovoracaceae bacterium]|nr:hypothetical protein [Bacteriovoracaceae bacterium]